MKHIKTPLRKIAGSLFVGAFMAGAAHAAPWVVTGDTVTVNSTAGRIGPGGAFAITGGTYAGPSFETFCLEYNEYLSIGGTYTVTLNTSAVQGGVGVVDNSVAGNHGVLNSYDPLSSNTAWLYSQFIAGGAGLTGWSPTAGNKDELQKAIWYFEDEIAMPVSGYALSLIADANSVTRTGLYGVRVMNLTDSNGRHQDLLAPIPEPGTYAMFLAGLGLMGVIARRRRAS